MWFVQDRRYQGALKHSGVIIPVAHRETVFDLTEFEVAATFRLLQRVKAWMDADFSPDGYNVGWNCGAWAGKKSSTPISTSFRGSDKNRWQGKASGPI